MFTHPVQAVLQQPESFGHESTTVEVNLNTDVEAALDAIYCYRMHSGTNSDEHLGGEINQDAKQYQVKSPLLNAELVKTKEMIEKETYNELSSRAAPEFREFFKINEVEKLAYRPKHHTNLQLEGIKLKSKKVFANIALKNELRSLIIGKIAVDIKFAKPSILGKPVLKSHQKPTVVRQPNALKSERPNFSKPRFASQVDVNNVLSKPITPHYLPKVREYVLAKPHHVIAPGSFRNSQEEPYGSNDMAHNHYLEKARKKTQERNMNSKPSVMHTTSLQNTTIGSKPNPRSNNQISRSLSVSKSSYGMSNGVSLVDHSRNSSSFSDSKHFVCSTCHKCVFNANHDNCITKFLKEVNSRAKVQSPKTRNNKTVVPKNHTQKPGRQITIGQRFSPKEVFNPLSLRKQTS
ncbi:hypothetical protein Tco_0573925 [Tanacetum coccineum]